MGSLLSMPRRGHQDVPVAALAVPAHGQDHPHVPLALELSPLDVKSAVAVLAACTSATPLSLVERAL